MMKTTYRTPDDRSAFGRAPKLNVNRSTNCSPILKDNINVKMQSLNQYKGMMTDKKYASSINQRKQIGSELQNYF